MPAWPPVAPSDRLRSPAEGAAATPPPPAMDCASTPVERLPEVTTEALAKVRVRSPTSGVVTSSSGLPASKISMLETPVVLDPPTATSIRLSPSAPLESRTKEPTAPRPPPPTMFCASTAWDAAPEVATVEPSPTLTVMAAPPSVPP